MTNVHKITLLSVLTAMAIVVSIIESFIPSVGIPGIKLGLANIVILLVLYSFSWKEALVVDLLRVYLAALLRGTIFQMGSLMSLSGALLSLLAMIILKYLFKGKFSIIGVSVIGALFHSLGQILVAIIYLGTASVLYYLPVLALVSLVTGLFVGYVSKKILDNGAIEKYKRKYGIE